MYRKLWSISLVLILLFAASQAVAFSFGNGKEGSGHMETRQLNLDEFHALDVGGAFDVEVSFGSKQKVEVTIDDNLWEHFDAKVKGQWLNLGWGRNCQPSNDCHVKIVVKKLEEVSIHGACDLDISGFSGHEFAYKLSGAGNLKMDGKVDQLEINISGAGEADTTDLKAKDVKVSISGAGNAEVYAKDSIRGRVSGVGNLTYYGDPEDKDTKVSGMGSIESK